VSGIIIKINTFVSENQTEIIMNKSLSLFIFLLISISTFGQAIRNSDGVYTDSKGKPFTGISYEYYHDSLVHISAGIKDGKLEGQTKIYFNNGQLEEIRSFKGGKMDGHWEKWNAENIKIAEAGYVDNKKDGKWYVWDENGTLRYDMTYSSGKKTGTWLMYDEKGKLTSEKSY
jgi:antitoxin component YwqK of YwqJK toxin-antitoxin module